MNIEEVKSIRIADYLQSLGYSPVKEHGGSLWYKSLFHQETEASFKVNIDLNLLFDYGLGKGGNIIALVQELNASSVSFSFNRQSSAMEYSKTQEKRVGIITSKMRKSGDARNSSSGDCGVASLCFGYPETSWLPLQESQGAASRWSIPYSGSILLRK